MRVVSSLGTLPGSKMDEPALTRAGLQQVKFDMVEFPRHDMSAPRQGMRQPGPRQAPYAHA